MLSRKPFSKKLLNQKSLLPLFGIIIIIYAICYMRAVCCFSTAATVCTADELGSRRHVIRFLYRFICRYLNERMKYNSEVLELNVYVGLGWLYCLYIALLHMRV